MKWKPIKPTVPLPELPFRNLLSQDLGEQTYWRSNFTKRSEELNRLWNLAKMAAHLAGLTPAQVKAEFKRGYDEARFSDHPWEDVQMLALTDWSATLSARRMLRIAGEVFAAYGIEVDFGL